MMNNIEKNFEEKFAECYKKVVTTAIYSMEIAQKIIGFPMNEIAINMPEKMAEAVEQNGGGCCFHHSWRLIHELNKAGILAVWGEVPEPTEERPGDHKCVVVYKLPNGDTRVADVVEDIKAAVQSKDFIDTTCSWKNSQGEVINNSRLTLKEMVKRSENNISNPSAYLRVYKNPNATETFWDFYSRGDYELILL